MGTKGYTYDNEHCLGVWGGSWVIKAWFTVVSSQSRSAWTTRCWPYFTRLTLQDAMMVMCWDAARTLSGSNLSGPHTAWKHNSLHVFTIFFFNGFGVLVFLNTHLQWVQRVNIVVLIKRDTLFIHILVLYFSLCPQHKNSMELLEQAQRRSWGAGAPPV